MFFDHEYMANHFNKLSNPNLYICLINYKYKGVIEQFKESYNSLDFTTNTFPTHLFNVQLYWTDKVNTWTIVSKDYLNGYKNI